MGRFVLAAYCALLVAACLGKPPRPGGDAGGDDTDFLDGYSYRKRIDITTGVASTLADFPIAITATDSDLAARARADGSDVVITGADGRTVLDSELAMFAAGAIELWVRVPSLAPSTTIYLYYGGPPVASTTTTWPARFAGVWHLSEDGAAAKDSTSHLHDMFVSSGAPSSVAGTFGNARAFGIADALDGGDPVDGSLDVGTSSFSYSLWVFENQAVGDFDMPFYKGGPSAGEPGYCVLLGAGSWLAKLTDTDGSLVDPAFGVEAEFVGRWVHLAAVVDRGADKIVTYADGIPKAEQSLASIGSLDTIERLAIARANDPGYNGQVDEVRIYTVALEPDWVAVEHRNASSDFLTIGPEQQP